MTGRHSARAIQAQARPPAAAPDPAPGRPGAQPATSPGATARRPRSGAARLPRWLRRPGDPLTLAALTILAATLAFCFIGPLVYHADVTTVTLTRANLPPAAGHPLGTDADGIDLLGRLMTGGRISLLVAIAAGLGSAIIGTAWGAVAGYLGGAADAVLMRVVDAVIAVPAIVIMLFLASVYRPSAALLVVVIAATSWLGTARLVRDETLTLRGRQYVQAVRAMGGGRARAVLRHIAPNASGTIIVNVSFQVADAILLLATLSYLRFGIQPPAADWGDMVASGAQGIPLGYWWEIYPPAAAIIAVVVGCHLLGDGLRDRMARRLPARLGG